MQRLNSTHLRSQCQRGPRMTIGASFMKPKARSIGSWTVQRAAGDQLSGIALDLSLANPAVAKELELVSSNSPGSTFARVNFHPECEAAINEQINIEYNVSYIYHALYAFFSRDNVALPGFAAYFKAGSEEEREHAELLMDYQNKRGGRVQLRSMVGPQADFDHPEKGEALYAMELALSLEKLNFQKLRELHAVASKHDDPSFSDFIEGSLLAEQEQAVKTTAEYVAQLRRVGKGLGVFEFDKFLAGKVAA